MTVKLTRVCICGEDLCQGGGGKWFCPNEECYPNKDEGIRVFGTGATRDSDEGKHSIVGFFSALVENGMAKYMHHHRKQSNGEMRSGGNWKKGIPFDELMESFRRHQVDVSLLYEGYPSQSGEKSLKTALHGVRFNVDGMLLQLEREELGLSRTEEPEQNEEPAIIARPEVSE